MKLSIPNLRNFRHALSTLLIVTGSALTTMTRETLAGILFIVLGVFIEIAAFAIAHQDSIKQ